ncbi:abortive phage infection protein [Comamonadaceae bacterium OH2310_COT-174]|nr:abortive phage infection protein [Comamonadaceae bacterium OH2310_COT-174]
MATNIARPLELDLLCRKLNTDYATHIIGTGTDDTAKRRNFLSKAVAAFVLREAAGASVGEAINASIDGGDDHGIDSVFIAPDHTIWLVQSKYIDSGKGEPELGDVSKFCDGVKDLLHGKMKRFNSALQERQIALTKVLNDDSCKIEVVLAHTGGAISDDRRNIFGDLERAFNGTNPDFIRCRAFGLATLHDLHLDGISADPIDAEVELKDFGYVNAPYRAFYGRMNVKRLVELWNDYRDQLVDRNIRRFKGRTTVNTGLSETLKTEAEHFFYFNNGVTFLCQKISEQHPRDSHRQKGKFRVQGISIINGAQTVGAISKESAAYYDEHPAEVLATFICLDNAPDDFGDRVTQSRNRQNAVDLEDFAALDERQDNWQKTLHMAGITYLVKQGEEDPPLSETCFSTREVAPYLACAITTANWPDYVVAAKTDKKKLFGRHGLVSAKDPLCQAYDTLFSDSLTAKRMWRIFQIGRTVRNMVKGRSAEPDPVNQLPETLPAREILKNGDWLILHIVFIRQKALLEGAELTLNDTDKQALSREVDQLASTLVAVVQAKQNWGKQARALFENKTDCQTIKNELMAALR